MSSEDDYVCSRCGNTGKSVATGHYCGCIHGERILMEMKKREEEDLNRPLNLEETVEILGADRVIKLNPKFLDPAGMIIAAKAMHIKNEM